MFFVKRLVFQLVIDAITDILIVPFTLLVHTNEAIINCSHSYVYYTDLPKDKKSVLEIRYNSTSALDLSGKGRRERVTTPTPLGKKKTPCLEVPRPESRPGSRTPGGRSNKGKSKLSKQRKKTSWADMEIATPSPNPNPNPLVEMTLEGKSLEKPRRQQLAQVASPPKTPQPSEIALLKPEPSEQKPPWLSSIASEQRPPWLSPTASRASLSRLASSRKLSPGQKRKAMKEEATPSKTGLQPTYNNTIRMQYSGMTGKPYAYGKGLPDDQSYLVVTSQTTF